MFQVKYIELAEASEFHKKNGYRWYVTGPVDRYQGCYIGYLHRDGKTQKSARDKETDAYSGYFGSLLEALAAIDLFVSLASSQAGGPREDIPVVISPRRGAAW